MSSQCQICSAPTDLYLCNRHVTELTKLLTDLPQWLRWLEESAIGQVKLGGGGRGSSRCEPFSGEDDALAKCTCKHGEHEGRVCDEPIYEETIPGPSQIPIIELVGMCRCTDYKPVADQAKLRAQFLATGRVNARASERLDAVRNTLATTIRHLCETRSIRLVMPSFIGPLRPGEARGPHRNVGDYARWLAVNVAAIACDETAGETFAEIEGHQKAIERIVNRPIPMRFLGKCPTWNEGTRRACGTELQCREGDLQVTCRACRQTHNTDRLQLLMMSDLERKKLTISQILKLRLPDEYQISERTLRRWRKPGPKGEPPRLRPCGYRRADGREVINRHSEDDEPLFRWSDVTRLRGEKPERKVKAG